MIKTMNYIYPAHAVDIIAFERNIENPNIISIALISRKNPPLGLALPGGFIDEGETGSHAAVRELYEELNLKPKIYSEFNSKKYKTSFFEGHNANGELYDPRGEITTIGYIFEVDLATIEAKDDAKSYEIISFDLSKDILSQIFAIPNIAMHRHSLLLEEALLVIKNHFNNFKTKYDIIKLDYAAITNILEELNIDDNRYNEEDFDGGHFAGAFDNYLDTINYVRFCTLNNTMLCINKDMLIDVIMKTGNPELLLAAHTKYTDINCEYYNKYLESYHEISDAILSELNLSHDCIMYVDGLDFILKYYREI